MRGVGVDVPAMPFARYEKSLSTTVDRLFYLKILKFTLP